MLFIGQALTVKRESQVKFSVNISKIVPPRLPQILPRPRLLNLLEKNRDKKLILILGQAAQGKTTLLASWLRSSNIPSAWINLDKGDSGAVLFFELIIHSLQRALKDVDFSPLLSYPLGSLGPGQRTLSLRDWVRSLSELINVPAHVVIDGLDRLAPDAPAFELLRILIDEFPPHIHLILLTRQTPPLLELEQIKMSQEAFILTNEDLAFNQKEIGEFFQILHRIPLTRDQLKKLFSATEGWVGGLILFSESLGRLSGDAREQYISDILPDRFRREVFDYLGREIFASQPQPDQEFLVKSSILDVVEPRFVKELLGFENADIVLENHVKRNLFVQPYYDEKKGWLFRYHQLLRAFLRAKFESEVGDEEKRSLFLKAASLYEERNELEDALKYFFEAKAFPQAVSTIEHLGADLLRRGRRQDLSQWILALPEKLLEENPWLLFYLTMTRRYRAGRENVVTLQKAYALFKERGDRKGVISSLSQLITMSISTGIHLVPIEQLLQEAEPLLHLSDLEKYPYERAMLLYSVGSAHIFGDGDIREGIWSCQNAHLFSKQLRDIWLQAYALIFSMFGLIFVGEFSLAQETLAKIERLVEWTVHPELQAVRWMVHGSLANYQGDFVTVKELVQRLQCDIEEHGFTFVAPWVFEVSGMLNLAQGKYAEAEEISRSYLNAASAVYNALFKGLALRFQGMTCFCRGRLPEAREALEQSLRVFSEESLSKYEFSRVKPTLALVYLKLKEYTRAERELDEALQYFLSVLSHLSLAMTHFVAALVKWEQGKKEEASLHLQTGLQIAKEKKYEYFYFLGAEYLLKVCLLALELKNEEILEYTAHLLSTRLSSVAEDGLKKLSNHRDLKVRERVFQIRRKIHRSKVPRLRIETFGGFRVFRGNSLMDEKAWDRNRPRQLLKAILAYGNQKVSRETLIDDLWPEEKSSAADKNFKTTLQRLRKSLEPTIHEDFGSSYVYLHDNLISLEQELIEVDMEAFLSLTKKGEEKEKEGDLKEALSLYADAADSYKGDFMPEEFHVPQVDIRREELKQKHIELLNRMANLHEKQGALRKAIDYAKKAIQADPLLEESYQKLMTLYFNKGMFNEALLVYEACKKALAAGLKTKPDRRTTDLYSRIREKVSLD